MGDLREHWIDVDGGQLFAVDTGSGAPVVMLHGWPLDHRMFTYQVAGLSDRFRCITLDRRGFGRSTAPPDMRRELHDIDRLADQLKLDPVHLLGVSQGGRIALRYAATRPGRLRSLVVQGAVVDGFEVDEPIDERVPVAKYAELARNGRLNEAVRAWREHPMMSLPDDRQTERRLIDLMLTAYEGRDLLDFDASHYAFTEDVISALSKLSLPVLVLTGRHETASRKAHEREILRRARNSSQVEFSDSGHLSNLTEPASYNRVVAEFLANVDSVAA